jgi:uncharacterized protein YndB with AHSA1/START domain
MVAVGFELIECAGQNENFPYYLQRVNVSKREESAMGAIAEVRTQDPPHGGSRPRRLFLAMPEKTKSKPATRSSPQLRLTQTPAAKVGMLIRKPVGEVFEAIIDPEITTQFWFTKSSGRLDAGNPVKWEWEMYDASTQVAPKSIEPGARILIEWDGYSGRTEVEWKFISWQDDTTFVSVTESGWTGSGDELAKYAADSTQGFSFMLAGLKALLEHGVKLNLTADRYPEGIEDNL